MCRYQCGVIGEPSSSYRIPGGSFRNKEPFQISSLGSVSKEPDMIPVGRHVDPAEPL